MLDRFWEILGWVFALNGEAFRTIVNLSNGLTLVIIIVLLAGFSQTIAHSIILFVNRVKPGRFAFSLLLNMVLFAAGFFFLVLSTWLSTLMPWSIKISFLTLVKVLGLSYAPLFFSLFGALPYLGVPILSVLSLWHLLAMVVGFASVTGLKLGLAFGYVAVGWIVLQILQRTIGQPIANLGRWLSNQVAGVNLATSQEELLNVLDNPIQAPAFPWKEELRQRIATVRQSSIGSALAEGDGLNKGEESALPPPSSPLPPPSSPLPPPPSSHPTLSTVESTEQRIGRTVKTLLGLLAIALLTFLIIVLLRPLREWWFGWSNNLPNLLQFAFDLVWIGVIAIVVAGLLAPLETLGWWAGWFEDEVDTTINVGELSEPVADLDSISRYLVYLDGICQSDFKYLPDVEEFLDTLTPTLPDHVALLRGIMVYSVLNNPLDEDRPLSFLWKLADRNRYANPADLLGLLVNIRNIIIVGVSADKRYGPLYNQGIAQVIYNGLLKNGYQPGSGTPVTLIGYSGGGQMSCGCAPYLKRALRAPIDVISLGGVISGNTNFLKLEHLYHLVGDKDTVEQIGPIMFPGRWKIFPLSYWNRAKRRGKISIFSMGPVGHQVPGGILCPRFILPDGRSALQQTIDYINAILRGDLLSAEDLASVKLSNYEHYIQSAYNRPESYPVQQSLPPTLYQPVGVWMGRLILPQLEDRQRVQGALFEIYHADAAHQNLVGKVVNLRWSKSPPVQKMLAAVKRDVHFSAEASYTSKYGGLVHPDRLNHWLYVDPLESLAGSHPIDDIVVMLNDPVEVVEQDDGRQAEPKLNPHPPSPIPHLTSTCLYISSQPVQITGRFYALVQFLQPVQAAGGRQQTEGSELFRVVHFDRASRQFDGPEEIVRLPKVIFAQAYGSYPSTTHKLETSPLNETGWYIYGAQDREGVFVVQAIGPRALFRLQPDQVVFGREASYNYIRKRAWADVAAQKGRISSVLCTSKKDDSSSAIQAAIHAWQEGDFALVLHVYGGIGGKQAEPAAATPIFFGHFAFGFARVVREPLSDELQFDLRYHQVYTHNTDGLAAGTLHWSRYLGDRQFGWLGTRPVCDILIKHDAFTGFYNFEIGRRSPIELMLLQLQMMTARYRTGDGTGGTYVGLANNCAQDSSRALFASLQQLEYQVNANLEMLHQWENRHPEQAQRFDQLLQLGKELKQELQPFGTPRADWERNEYNLGETLEDHPIQSVMAGLGSWRTILPRLASDTVVKIFLKHGATVWVLRTNQVGGYDPNIKPIAPITF